VHDLFVYTEQEEIEMTSGQYITWFLILSVLVVFPAWELIQLQRRRNGNKSALTMSQYIGKKIEAGSKPWTYFVIVFPIFIIVVAVWLLFHWEGLCLNLNLFCEIK
jgi:uncharacterized membrane protein